MGINIVHLDLIRKCTVLINGHIQFSLVGEECVAVLLHVDSFLPRHRAATRSQLYA